VSVAGRFPGMTAAKPKLDSGEGGNAGGIIWQRGATTMIHTNFLPGQERFLGPV
jgi:hypothetical protein